MLYRATPEEVKFIFIDTKRLELGIYDAHPAPAHARGDRAQEGGNALRWACQEMERRYKIPGRLRRAQHRPVQRAAPSAAGKKPSATVATADGGTREEEVKPIPYIVVVIDELADLDDHLRRGRRGGDHAPRPDGPRRGHPPDPLHPAPLGGRHHRRHQGQLPVAGSPSASPPRWTRAPSSTATAPSSSWGTATCSSCRPGSSRLLRLHGSLLTRGGVGGRW